MGPRQFDRDFKKPDKAVQRRIMAYLESLEGLEDPRQRGKALTANRAGVWRYQIGDHRVLSQTDSSTVTILALRLGHRRNVY